MHAIGNKLKCNNLFWLSLSVLVVAIPKLVVIKDTYPFTSLSDGVATISGAAFFAGYDWSPVVSNAGYYGQGFYSLFFLLFSITDNPILISRTILMICVLLQLSIPFMVFYILDKGFGIKNCVFKFLLACIAGYFVSVRIDNVSNEHILIILSWLLYLLLFKLMSERCKKKKILWGIIFSVILGWGVTIHTRFWVYIIALSMMILIFGVIYKKLVLPGWVLLMSILSISCGYLFAKWIQGELWSVSDSVQLRNASPTFASSIDWTSVVTWRAIFNIILGQLNTITVVSCGAVVFSAVIIIGYLINNKKNFLTEEYKFVFLTFGICLLAVGGTIVAQSVSGWLSDILTKREDVTDPNIYAYKAFVYIRYFQIYVAPIMIMGLALGSRYKQKWGKIVKYSVLFIIFLQMYWLFSIQPLLAFNVHARADFMAFARWTNDKTFLESPYYYGILFLLSFVILSSTLLMSHIDKKVILALVLVVLIDKYLFVAYQQDIVVQQRYASSIDDTYELLSDFLDSTEQNDIHKIYYIDYSQRTDHNIWYAVQFYFPRYQIIPVKEIPDDENAIILSNSESVALLVNDNDYLIEKLDSQEYILIIGRNYMDIYLAYKNLIES